MTRRESLFARLAAGTLALLTVAAAAAPAKSAAPWSSPELKAAAAQLDTTVRGWLEQGVARGDGWTYAMDVAPLMLHAAERRDAALYARLAAAAAPLVTTAADDTDGFVLWRWKDGAAPEISGATEALWLARALTEGGKAFARPEDTALAARVLAGYARHAAEQQGTWLVRKYWSFGGRAFTSLSVLPNYQADFVAASERAVPALKGFGPREYNAVQRAVAPAKLLVPLVQPAVGKDFPNLNVHRYAPNNVVSLEDSCLAAEAAQRGLPEVARGVLAFTAGDGRHNEDGRLFAYFHRRSGLPLGTQGLGSAGYACLGRLARSLNDRAAALALAPVLAADMAAIASAPPGQAAPLYGAGPLLRAAHALQAFE
jgi:hypothetical protein